MTEFLNKYEKHISTIFKLSKYVLMLLIVFLVIEIIGSEFLLSLISKVINAILPFLISILIVYIIYPVLHFIEQKSIFKSWFVLVVSYLVIIATIFLAVFYWLVPTFLTELTAFIDNIPKIIDAIKDNSNGIIDRIKTFENVDESFVNSYINKTESLITEISNNILFFIANLASVAFKYIWVVVLVPIIVLYMIKDYDKILDYIKGILPKKYKEDILILSSKIDKKLGTYIRSQLIIMFFMSVASTVLLFIAGYEYPYVFGITIGVTNVIPYLGPYIGAIPVLIYGIFASPKILIAGIVIIIVLQNIEGNILQPLIMGKTLSFHPIVIMLSMVTAGALFGVVGIIFAVPLLIFIYEIGKHIINKKNGNLEKDEIFELIEESTE